jgi:hypothetical protein
MLQKVKSLVTKFKKSLVVAAVAVAVVSSAGYFGKKHFDENYVILEQEVLLVGLYQTYQGGAQMGYEKGLEACKNAT